MIIARTPETLVHQTGKLGVPVFIWTTLIRTPAQQDWLSATNIFPGCQLCRLCALVMVCEVEHTFDKVKNQISLEEFEGSLTENVTE